MKIGIIIGSIREGRLGEAVAEWVMTSAPRLDGVEWELLDLKAFDVPLLTSRTHPMAAEKQYPTEQVQRWSDAVDACDGFVVVTPEYNHGIPGALKNAIDSLGMEWWGKAVGFVGYGAGGGQRPVEQLRQVLANFNMYDVRASVQLNIFTDVVEGRVSLPEARHGELGGMLEQLVEAARKLSA